MDNEVGSDSSMVFTRKQLNQMLEMLEGTESDTNIEVDQKPCAGIGVSTLVRTTRTRYDMKNSKIIIERTQPKDITDVEAW